MLWFGRLRQVMALVVALGLAAGCEPDITEGPLDRASGALETTGYTGSALGAPDYALVLTGEGATSGVPLSATVEIDVVDAQTARLVVTNTSPAGSSSEPGGPVLTRLGFNLADGPSAGCLVVSADGRFALARRVQPFCGSGGDRFQYSLDASNPAPENGIAREESLTIELSIPAGCAATFSRDTFAAAPETASDGEPTQWAAKFQVVGPGGEDSGCAQGVPEDPREPEYIWSEFIATAAEIAALPSLYAAADTRAGSVELNYNGSFGFDSPWTDQPYQAGILTMRNGRGAIVEQWLLNRRWAPAVLDADGCSVGTTVPQCWVWNPLGAASAAVPTYAGDSNDGFDPGSAQRVTVSAETTIDAGGAPDDNSAQWLRVTWEDPSGIATARLHLRLHYDANLDGTLVGDPIVSLYRVRWPGDGPDLAEDFVNVLVETETAVTVEVNVQDAVDHVWDTYLGLPGYLP